METPAPTPVPVPPGGMDPKSRRRIAVAVVLAIVLLLTACGLAVKLGAPAARKLAQEAVGPHGTLVSDMRIEYPDYEFTGSSESDTGSESVWVFLRHRREPFELLLEADYRERDSRWTPLEPYVSASAERPEFGSFPGFFAEEFGECRVCYIGRRESDTYRISYFAVRDGEPVGPDRETTVYWDRAAQVWSLELPPIAP